MGKKKTILKTEKEMNFKSGKHWQVSTFCFVFGGLSLLTQLICSTFLTDGYLQNTSLSNIFFVGIMILSATFVLSNLTLSNSSFSVYGIPGSSLLQMRTSQKQLKLATQMLIVLSWGIWSVVFSFLNWTVANFSLFITELIFVCYHLNNTFRLCFDKKYMLERVQKLIDQSFVGESKLEQTFMIESLCLEITKNNKTGNIRYLTSDINLLFYIYVHTENLQIKSNIETKLESVVKELLPTQSLQYIMNEILKKLENLNNKLYTKLALIITHELLQKYTEKDKATLDSLNILQTLYTLFRPITDKEYLENLIQELSSFEVLILQNTKLTQTQKNMCIRDFYKTLASFHYLPETLKSLNLTCFVTIILQKLQNGVTDNMDILLSALQESEKDNYPLIQYLIACIHTLLYAYDRKYQLPIIKDMLVTLSLDETTNTWTDLENHLHLSDGIYLKYYQKIMEQISNISEQVDEPTFISYANEFFLYYWFMQNDSKYSLKFEDQSNMKYINHLIDVINYTEQQKFSLAIQFANFYGYKTTLNREKANKIIDYIRNQYTKLVFDHQKSIQTEVMKKGIERICQRVNTYCLDHQNEIPFSKTNLNINDNNTYTLKFLITNQDLKTEYIDELLQLVNSTYQSTILKEIVSSIQNKLDLKTFYYRNRHENLSYITNWLNAFNCDCKTRFLSQNIEVLDNLQETNRSQFEAKEKMLTDVSKIGANHYVYLNSDKVNIFNCPLSTTIRELSQSELEKLLEENKQGNYYQIENFLSDREDATNYYQLTYKILELQYSMETIIEERAGFEIIFGTDDKENKLEQNQLKEETTSSPIQNQTSLDSLLTENKEDNKK